MAKTFSFVPVEPVDGSNFVKLTYTGYPTNASNAETRIYAHDVTRLVRDNNNNSFGLYINGGLFISFAAAEVVAPAFTDVDDLCNKLCAMFGHAPISVEMPSVMDVSGSEVAVTNVVEVSIDDPVAVTGSVSASVTGTVAVSNFPSSFDVVVANFPSSFNIGTVSGTVNTTVSGTVRAVVSGTVAVSGGTITAGNRTLTRFFGQVTNSVQTLTAVATKIYRVQIINPPNVITTRSFLKAADTTGTVTIGTTAPNMIWSVDASGEADDKYGDDPIIFSNGLKIWATSDSDTSSSGAPQESIWVEIAYSTT